MEEAEDEWDWDDEEKIVTGTGSRKDDCTITADNLHLFGFYKGQSVASTEAG